MKDDTIVSTRLIPRLEHLSDLYDREKFLNASIADSCQAEIVDILKEKKNFKGIMTLRNELQDSTNKEFKMTIRAYFLFFDKDFSESLLTTLLDEFRGELQELEIQALLDQWRNGSKKKYYEKLFND